jgi:hypothetical protein
MENDRCKYMSFGACRNKPDTKTLKECLLCQVAGVIKAAKEQDPIGLGMYCTALYECIQKNMEPKEVRIPIN